MTSEPSKIRIRESAEVTSTSDGLFGQNCSEVNSIITIQNTMWNARLYVYELECNW